MPGMGLPLSICIPTCNRARLLERTLAHLAAVPALFSEVVISDNASEDDTAAVVAAWRGRFARLDYRRQPENRGAFRNIDAALMAARAAFAFVLSDDDALIADGIVDALARLSADPEAVAVFGGYERCDADLAAVTSVTLPPFPGRYTRADKTAMARNGNMMTFGVMRTATVQRHGFLDGTTLGLWRLLGQLLDQGAVHVIDRPLYRHAETPERLENQAVDAAFHDAVRSDWELYAASIEGVDHQTTVELVVGMTMQPYLIGMRAAAERGRALLERTFLLRYLAYVGQAPGAAEVRETWERTRLVAAAVELLVERLTAASAARVLVERGPLNVGAMLRGPGARVPLAIVELDPAALAGVEPAPGDYLVVEFWSAVETLGADRFAGRQIAVADLIASLRLPGSSGQRLLGGADGVQHLLRV